MDEESTYRLVVRTDGTGRVVCTGLSAAQARKLIEGMPLSDQATIVIERENSLEPPLG